MLDHITPVLLTYNEAPNIGRTLSHLMWAKDIVVVDSGSTDDTVDILKRFPNVRMFTRPFDTHGNQWCFAVTETAIASSWILRLDADYQVTPALLDELRELNPDGSVDAYRIGFDYAIFSQRLSASLYPPKPMLLRCGRFKVSDNANADHAHGGGHGDVWTIDGAIGTLKAHVIHDDWKTVESWVRAQARYVKLEFETLKTKQSGLRDWLRLRPPLMPIAVFFYCLFGKGLILNGRTGLFYTLQRMIVEAALSLMILELELRKPLGTDQAEDGDR